MVGQWENDQNVCVYDVPVTDSYYLLFYLFITALYYRYWQQVQLRYPDGVEIVQVLDQPTIRRLENGGLLFFFHEKLGTHVSII